NPPGDSAGRLIEAAGLKGLQLGGARISEKHANFFLNEGAGTAADVLSLIRTAQEKVAERFGVRLDLEIELLGDWTEAELDGL
ncbi:MAG TPA: UDP-N-acetylenolpyruvoylglucosamine reductase, partial [Chloroflexi bacterium]|nr:UDP-N-acetylenolpyruvoylglucosamine reductase [Chloroflexota bacterium]